MKQIYVTQNSRVLGMISGDQGELVVNPRIAKTWPRCRITYRLPNSQTRYDIAIENPDGRETSVRTATLDGSPVTILHGAAHVPLVDDGRRHEVRVCL